MTTYYAASPSMRGRTSITPLSADYNSGYSDGHVSRSGGRPLGHSQHYFNPARNEMYSRFTTGEWDASNKANYNLSERERSFAERLRADAWRAVKSTDARTRNRQQANTKRLGERVYDITFWKQELNSEIDAMQGEIANLQEHKRVLEKAYADTRTPLAIAEDNLMQREKRLGIDMVHDDVERNLSREVNTIRRCQEKMKRLIEKAYVQLKMNRAAQHNCEKDSKDKHHAQHLDDRMHYMRNSTGGIGFFPGIETIDNTLSIPQSWVKFTQENIARSQREREMSEKLRGAIDACLRQCANDMWSQFNCVNNQFNSRIQESQDAKNKLQAHLNRTVGEIADMDRSIELLRQAIRDKEAPMKVAQTRLDERTRRIHVEICNDPVMKGLQREVAEIRESVRILKERLRAGENALVRLLKTKACLEHDISVKENSIHIDSKYCMGARKGMPMDPKIGPIFQMPLTSY